MAKTAVIIPVKQNDPKSRLNKLFSKEERKQLQMVMLEDVLRVLLHSGLVQDTYVVSRDTEVLNHAVKLSANSLHESYESGVNNAVYYAMNLLEGYAAWLIIPSDIPLLSSREIQVALHLHKSGADVVISPSRKLDGTNLLLITSISKIPLHYDDDSFKKHIREALDRRLRTIVYYSDGICSDLDEPDDINAILNSGARNCTTTFLLSKLNRELK